MMLQPEHRPDEAGHILVVDDQISIREMMSEFLRHLGYGVTLDEGGHRAIALYQQRPVRSRVAGCRDAGHDRDRSISCDSEVRSPSKGDSLLGATVRSAVSGTARRGAPRFHQEAIRLG